jgi:hypothetical protein
MFLDLRRGAWSFKLTFFAYDEADPFRGCVQRKIEEHPEVNNLDDLSAHVAQIAITA